MGNGELTNLQISHIFIFLFGGGLGGLGGHPSLIAEVSTWMHLFMHGKR